MKVISAAANFHCNGDDHEPKGRATFEFSGKEVAEALLKCVEDTIKKSNIDACKAYVVCPECNKNIGVDELKVSLVVNFYG